MRKTQQAQHWAQGEASEKRGGVIEAARERLMVHINWGWFVWSTGSGCSSQVCRGAGRQMWGPLCPLQGQSRAVRRLRNSLSVQYVCAFVEMRCGWGEQTTCFSFLLISHLLCLDYYFGKKPMKKRCINICSQFAHLTTLLYVTGVSSCICHFYSSFV